MATPTPVALVLEDEREIRQFVRSSLEAEGWWCTRPAASGRGWWTPARGGPT